MAIMCANCQEHLFREEHDPKQWLDTVYEEEICWPHGPTDSRHKPRDTAITRIMPMLKPHELTQVTNAAAFYFLQGYHDFDHQVDTFSTEMVIAYHILTHPRYVGDPDECADCVDECR